jgi:8-oxo-dGTP diphosphatase
VIRELAEETGCDGVVERLRGVDSRVIPAAEAQRGIEHQNVGIFYQVRVTGGALRPEPDGETAESVWTPIDDVAGLRRSFLVDVGLALAQTLPLNWPHRPGHRWRPDPALRPSDRVDKIRETTGLP